MRYMPLRMQPAPATAAQGCDEHTLGKLPTGMWSKHGQGQCHLRAAQRMRVRVPKSLSFGRTARAGVGCSPACFWRNAAGCQSGPKWFGCRIGAVRQPGDYIHIIYIYSAHLCTLLLVCCVGMQGGEVCGRCMGGLPHNTAAVDFCKCADILVAAAAAGTGGLSRRLLKAVEGGCWAEDTRWDM